MTSAATAVQGNASSSNSGTSSWIKAFDSSVLSLKKQKTAHVRGAAAGNLFAQKKRKRKWDSDSVATFASGACSGAQSGKGRPTDADVMSQVSSSLRIEEILQRQCKRNCLRKCKAVNIAQLRSRIFFGHKRQNILNYMHAHPLNGSSGKKRKVRWQLPDGTEVCNECWVDCVDQLDSRSGMKSTFKQARKIYNTPGEPTNAKLR